MILALLYTDRVEPPRKAHLNPCILLCSQPMNGVVANGPISDTPAVQQGWPTLGDAAAPHKKKSVPPPTPELLPAAEVCAVQPHARTCCAA